MAEQVLVDSNVLLGGACNLTTRPMPAGADIANYEQCSNERPHPSAGNCSFHDIVLHGNFLAAVKSCPKKATSTSIPTKSDDDDLMTTQASGGSEAPTIIVGVNYVPSYARNDIQIWQDFDPV